MKGLAIIAAVAVVSLGGYLGVLQLTGNVHVVDQGQLYRSAQLNQREFERVISKYGIKSIVNLRGAHPSDTWYVDEVGVAKARAVTHYDIGISAEHIVTPAQIASILAVLRAAPKPILIHCQGGADRSGLVAALYEAVIEGKSVDEADGQLSLRYGHFPYLGSRTGAMDQSYWAYVDAR
ncbi:MAG: dual specificity protein phosphatase family protein [Gemmatimonadaceae bacterium]